MTHRTRFFKLRLSLTALGLMAVMALVGCMPAPHGNIDPDTVHVTASGSAVGVPDQANIRFTVRFRGDALGDLQANTDRVTGQLRDVLLEHGVPREHIQSWQLQIQPRYNYRDGEAIFAGYEVSRVVQVTLADLNLFDRVIDDAIDVGVVQVDSIRFSIADPTALYAQAREEAVRQAHEKANELAKHSSRRISHLLRITEQGDAPAHMDMAPMRMAMESSVTEPGQQRISVSVQVEFALRPAR